MKFTEKHFLYLYNENMVTYQPKKETLRQPFKFKWP